MEEKVIRRQTLEKYRHMSFVGEEYVAYKKFEVFKRAKSLRTFLVTWEVESWHLNYLSNKILVELLPELPLLRVLSLSNFDISEVPESIGSLRHLRYLNLSRTGITCLSENVCNLYNLQTLILFNCFGLANLPNNFSRLKNLRHFDIRGTPLLYKMPLGIGKLKSLQTLSKIIIGGESGFEISKLRELKNLCGKISIEDLEKVQNGIHAREANLSQKRLSELELVWGDVSAGSRNEKVEKEVLDELKPHSTYLNQLKIWSYGGLEFPNWVGDPSFLRLKHVSICDCKKCTYLPPLGQLPSLKELFIEGLDGVEVVGMELLGTSCVFPSLEILSFKDMLGWKKWSTSIGVVFPCVQQLLIGDCPNLVEVLVESLPSLNVLEISKCDSDVVSRLIQVASSVKVLKIKSITGLNDVVWRSIIEYLEEVEELQIQVCHEIRYLWESEAAAGKALVNLKKLEVDNCDNLLSLAEKEEDISRSNLLTSLRMLTVVDCYNMERCRCPDNIESLLLIDCISITSISLPTRGQKLKSLKVRRCNELLERVWGGQKTNNNNALENVEIWSWLNLRSVVGLNYLVHLTSLSIIRCESLESFPANELLNLTSLKRLEITKCPKLDVSFPCGIWPPNLSSLKIGMLKRPMSEWGPQSFPISLVELSLFGDDGVSSCSQFSHHLPTSLTSLCIHEFDKLESLKMGVQHLTSLQHLYFFRCPNMVDLPEMLLPSLLSLHIVNSPNLEERCSKRGSYWPFISHIPCVSISNY